MPLLISVSYYEKSHIMDKINFFLMLFLLKIVLKSLVKTDSPKH